MVLIALFVERVVRLLLSRRERNRRAVGLRERGADVDEERLAPPSPRPYQQELWEAPRGA